MDQLSTQEQLLDVGEVLMRQRGYGGFSYADLARETGIRKASVHHHFATKADFGLAVFQRYAARFTAVLRDFSGSRTGGQALYRAIQFYRDALADGEQLCLCAALSSDRQTLSEEVCKALADANAATVQWIEGVLLQGRRDRSISVGGEPSEEALAILAQLQGAQLLARAANDVTLFDQATAPLIARLNRY